MAYTVQKLAALSGVTARTLRYYDKIGLLTPERTDNGYRLYGQAQLDMLQQILFHRALGFSLEDIRRLVSSPDFDRKAALEGHLDALLEQKARLETLIENVGKSIRELEGGIVMEDSEKFEGFKKKLIADNEAAFGAEVREKFGDEAADASNAKLAGMTMAQWQAQKELGEEILTLLKTALALGDPACGQAQQACEKHRRWLGLFWKDGSYSKQAHRGLAEMYVADERFRAYYDQVGAGAAEFFRAAIDIYCA